MKMNYIDVKANYIDTCNTYVDIPNVFEIRLPSPYGHHSPHWNANTLEKTLFCPFLLLGFGIIDI